jgi:chemotaxis protein MotB
MSAAPQPEVPIVSKVGKQDPAPQPEPVAGAPGLPVEEGAPSWVITFGDMMSLLLTFFILLFSMSEIEVEKFRQAVRSLHEGFGESTIDLGEAPPPTPSDTTIVEIPVGPDPADEKLDEIASLLQQFVEDNGLQQNLVVDRSEDGVHLQIRDVALFQPGEAEIETSTSWIVEQLGQITLGVDVPVTVAGHTDTVPISSSRFQSNWELSAARAAGVARTLVAMGHLPDEVQVTAFGEHRPIDTNETPEGRSRNRRVELFYSKQSVDEALERGAGSGERGAEGGD